MFDWIKVSAISLELEVANTKKNVDEIILQIKNANRREVSIAVFPELCITGYTCQDMFFQSSLLKEAKDGLKRILEETKDTDVLSIVGLPLYFENRLVNGAAVIYRGRVLGISVKTYIPNYNEFYEARWFSSADDLKSKQIEFFGECVQIGNDLVFVDEKNEEVSFSVEICEDLWAPIPPSSYHVLNGALLILNPSASNEVIGKSSYRERIIHAQSGKGMCGYVYASAGIDESTTDVVYGGHLVISENGKCLASSERFKEGSQYIDQIIDIGILKHERMKNKTFMAHRETKEARMIKIPFVNREVIKYDRFVDPYPFVPSDSSDLKSRCEEIFHIQTSALLKRIKHIGTKKAVVGISGGLDSTLALLVVKKTFDKLNIPSENIIAVTMPGFGTTDHTYTNACELIRILGCTFIEVDIKEACMIHYRDIEHDVNVHNVTYENVQARERTQILMDIANKEGTIVVGTGDLSEIALGWSTYNGDHMSMYAVNASIPKTLVKFLIDWVKNNEVSKGASVVLESIINTPISPELLPPDENGEIKQKTEEVVGPYELHDFILYYMFRYGFSPTKIFKLAKVAFEDKYEDDVLIKWLKSYYKRFFMTQFKRSCMPDGPKVGSIALSPRGDLRMPSDAKATIWIKEISEIEDML